MDIKVIVATHKQYRMPSDNCYMPLHVGKQGKVDLGYLGDDSGDSISEKNGHYCELTGLYWAWKNLKSDYLDLFIIAGIWPIDGVSLCSGKEIHFIQF